MKSVDIEKILAILAGRKIGEKKVGGSKKIAFHLGIYCSLKFSRSGRKLGWGGRGNLASEERKKEKKLSEKEFNENLEANKIQSVATRGTWHKKSYNSNLK